ncbi:MAG: hypothetical protein D6B27_00555 [Gammaproteobacteria bacterium]|nr:MAG: hypothetical protein D6B27_00555 [Gammaproteobacteria bacterium]
MREHWAYSKEKHIDSNGEKWHFVSCQYLSDDIDYYETPMEYYFRNDARTYFGCLRFERKKDNPYRFSKLAEKVMKNKKFREQCYSPESEAIWSKSWK